MTDAAPLTIFAHDPAGTAWLRSGGGVHVVRRVDARLLDSTSAFIVMTLASRLPDVAQFVTNTNHRHRLRGLLVHLDNPTMDTWLPQMLDRASLRTVRNCLPHKGEVIPRRVVEAWRAGAQNVLLADVSVSADTVFAMTCGFERLEIPFSAIPALARLSAHQRQCFAIAADGNYVYWPDGDVHLDVDAFKVAGDPRVRDKAMLERAKHISDFGAGVRAVRTRRQVRMSEVDGVSERQLRRIETGEFFPRVATLQALAQAHHLDLTTYLSEVAAAHT